MTDIAISIRDFEVRARDRLAQGLYDWYAGGAADEITLQAWRSRGIGTRLKETVARIWAYYL